MTIYFIRGLWGGGIKHEDPCRLINGKGENCRSLFKLLDHNYGKRENSRLLYKQRDCIKNIYLQSY